MPFFDIAIARVLRNEGGYSNRPLQEDPGGETYRGISRVFHPEWDGWAKVDSLKGADFPAALDRDGYLQQSVTSFYKSNFWDKVNGDALPPAVAYQALDFAVNSGVDTAVRKLQSAAGVADDGKWGPHSQQAASTANPVKLAIKLIAERQRFLSRLKNYSANAAGWASRIAADLDDLCLDF